MRQVGIPTGVVGMPSSAIKVFAVLAAHCWPAGMSTNQVADLCGLNWRTAATALELLRASGWLDDDNQPVEGGA